MRSVGFGDGALAAALGRQVTSTKAEVGRLSIEATTGVARDLGHHLRGDLGALAGLQGDLGRLAAYGVNAATAALQAASMQTALEALDGSAADYATALVTAASSSQPAQLSSVIGEGEQRFSAAIAALNTRVGARSLFAGVAVENAALAAPGAILDRLQTLTAAAQGADELEAIVTAWFADPAGFAAEGYTGGGPQGPVAVAAGEEVALDVTATDPLLHGTLAGLAIAALLDRGSFAGDAGVRADLARRAGETLLEAQTDRAALAARLGSAEATIADAAARNAAETSAHELARAELISVDPYEAATGLQAARDRLETLYSITARLSRLSLLDYL